MLDQKTNQKSIGCLVALLGRLTAWSLVCSVVWLLFCCLVVAWLVTHLFGCLLVGWVITAWSLDCLVGRLLALRSQLVVWLLCLVD